MRILMVFIDMLRSELVFSTQADSQIMKTCRKIGGTLFEACYTPAPDTYRSMGALWSSCYPAENGCDNRCKRPFEWLKKPEETFLEYLIHMLEHGKGKMWDFFPTYIQNIHLILVPENL